MIKINNDLAIISKEDDVAVALRDLNAGYKISTNMVSFELVDDIPFGHKIALKDIHHGENIIKYGNIISFATQNIKKGEHVHSHNSMTNLNEVLNYEYAPFQYELNEIEDKSSNTFMGYLRKDGRAGTRNDIWILPTVGCVNKTANHLEVMANKLYGDKVDNILAIPHNVGCSQLGDDMETTQKILAAIANHPNAGGVLIISLGCENNNLEEFKPFLGEIDSNRVKFMVTQNLEDEYEEGMRLIAELVEYADTFKRQELPVSKLTIGFKCGGSDAFSGITANPLCGHINDNLVAKGGSTILTEVPEMFGAETILMNRAKDEETFLQIIDLINNYKKYFIKYDQPIYENPAPGNKKGGITTLEEKSLGCIQKGGNATVVGVLNYGEQVSKHGLNLLNGSGNDQISCTNLLASGANIILFTTGRGNPFGSLIPTLKISSNTELANRKPHWIDYDAGKTMYDLTMEDAARELWSQVLQVASGEVKTNNEKHGYKDISVFRDGVIL